MSFTHHSLIILIVLLIIGTVTGNALGEDILPRSVKLLASDGQADDRFGSSVAVDGDTALVGVPLDDDKGGASGSAYVFERDRR